MTSMPHRRMGRSGLQLSLLSFGSWVTFGNQVDTGLAVECLAAAREGGVTFFDNAEAYGGGESERIMGAGHRPARVGTAELHRSPPSSSGACATAPNMRNTLNRKYLMQAMDGSLERFGLDFVDLVYCHRPDPRPRSTRRCGRCPT